VVSPTEISPTTQDAPRTLFEAFDHDER